MLRRGGSFEEAIERANAYLDAGGDSAFVLGLDTEDLVNRAVDAIDGPVATIVKYGSVPIARLAELGDRPHQRWAGLGQVRGRRAAALAETLNARGDYPEKLTF